MTNPTQGPDLADLRAQLTQRREAIAQRWYQAITKTGFASLRGTSVRQRILALTDRAIELLTTESLEPQQAESIGSELASFHYLSPKTLARTQTTLSSAMLEGLSQAQVCVLQKRLTPLFAGLSTGFLQQSQDTILHEQEQIRNALISEIQQAKRELSLKETAIASSINGIAFCDLEGQITYVNPAFLEMWGYDEPAEVVGRPATDFGRHPERVWIAIRAITESGGWIGELVAQRKDGSCFDVQVSASVLEQDEGEPIQLMGSFIDITERRQAEAEKERHLARLEILHQIDQAILEAKSSQEIAEAGLRQIHQLVPCKRSSVVLFDYEANEMELLAVQSASETAVGPGKHYSLDHVKDHLEVLREQEVFTSNINQWSDLPGAFPALRSEGLKRFLAVPLRYQGKIIGTLTLWSEDVNAFSEEYIPLAQEVGDSITIAIRHARLLESVRQQRQELQTALRRLAEAEEAERRRVAHTLHDRVGQALTALGLNLTIIQSQFEPAPPEMANERIADSFQLIEDMADRIRRVTADLRPPLLEDYGLDTALESYARESARRSDLTIDVDCEPPMPELAPEIETALFRITQEAVTNAIKHAEASQVQIQLKTEGPIARLIIEDDGVGFDSDGRPKRDAEHGLGLLSMKERAQAVGGRCHVDSCPDAGTSVIVEVNCDH